ncbi:MAG TPA: multicopper oxidase domain-containing protein [Nitrososphaeraceae archaeon]|jgi:FtsP/CotA-like multicopper oxidase with cupredoxin domain|nr:multicopper oxidase domain-containing protein [Nitrososphaeraceae archaeon]
MAHSRFVVIFSVMISVIILGLSLVLYSRASVTEQNSSKIDTVGGHTPGYPILQTTGDVLDPTSLNINPETAVVDPSKYLREFNYGTVTNSSNGTKIREFTLIASDTQTKEVSPGVLYNVWTFNGTIPGPTIRATEGDTIRITLINNGSKFHSIHFHGIHPSEMDGVFEGIAPGGKFTYEFTAEPFGVFPYHCHMQPLEEHITHGLYGALIIDPKKPRASADEMIMIMNGYDTDFDTENNFYTVNGIPYYYMHHPIQIDKNRLIRIYLLNMLEFDPLNNFHLHANMFDFYKTGTKLIPDEYTDIVTMNQAERGILEFSYKYPGKYMFHAHKTEFAEKGWTGLFLVNDETSPVSIQNSNLTAATTNATDQIPYNTSNLSNVTSILPAGGLK